MRSSRTRRRGFVGRCPYVVVLQSDLAETGDDAVVAPMAARPSGGVPARLFPIVRIGAEDYSILVLGLTTLRRRLLARSVAVLDRDGDGARLKKALDYLFFGV